MDVNTAALYTDFSDLHNLKYDKSVEEQARLKAVAKQFEGIFLQMMLKSMRDANMGEDLFDNDLVKMYQDLFDKQVALELGNNRGIGLADMIAKQLDGDLKVGHIVSVAVGDVTRSRVDFVSINQENATSRFVSSLHRAGKEVHVWTVNDAKRMSSIVDLGVDNIITDEPATLRSVLNERAEMSNAERLLLGVRHWLVQ